MTDVSSKLENLLDMIVVEEVDMKTEIIEDKKYKKKTTTVSAKFYDDLMMKNKVFYMKSACAKPSRTDQVPKNKLDNNSDILIRMRFGNLVVAFCTINKTMLKEKNIVEIRNICSLGSDDLLDVIMRKAENVSGSFGVKQVLIYPDLSNVKYLLERGYIIDDEFNDKTHQLKLFGSILSILKEQFVNSIANPPCFGLINTP